MAASYAFGDEEMTVDEILGFPTAYAKLCKDKGLNPYSLGPPLTFTPYSLHPQQAMRAKELDAIFPIRDPQAKPTTNPKIFVSLLWKQLNHLGNAGFDPAMFRVDPYGNVVYYHADSASPLAWDVDHWFPCSRGGLTVPRNLRILQWQVCKRKHNQLEILVPWWDLQLGISINQFLSIFAASNSDFRRRAFSLLFSNGENEEPNDSQTVDAHNFPQHFMESKERSGLAPAAIVLGRNELHGASTLKSIDINRQASRPPSTPIVAATKPKYGVLKENQNPDMVTNPYQAIAMARDSLKQKREEEPAKLKGDIRKLDEEMIELRQKNEEEKATIQDLERVLTKRRCKAEQCRRLAEAQSSYRITLEKMIRDAMHQSLVYKQQARLNQAATSALMASLEAQRALCDSAEKELHRKYKQRDDLEKQIRPPPQLEKGKKKRSRQSDALLEELDSITPPSSSILKSRTPRKELRAFLEEEEAMEGQRKQAAKAVSLEAENAGSITAGGVTYGHQADDELQIGEEKEYKIRISVSEPEIEENEESKEERGKGYVEKWLRMLLDNSLEGIQAAKDPLTSKMMNEKYMQKGKAILQSPEPERKEYKQQRFHENDSMVQMEVKACSLSTTPRRAKPETSHMNGANSIIEVTPETEAKACHSSSQRRAMPYMNEVIGIRRNTGIESSTERAFGIGMSGSTRALRRFPSSPSMITGMKKGVECMTKKPQVIDDDGDKDKANCNKFPSRPLSPSRQFIKSSIKSIKKVVKL
ncbi:hypothetical protein Dimus_027807 [Dionaea muscipula]